MLNIGAEKFWHPAPAGVTDRAEDRVVGRAEEMNLLLCRKQDVLVLRERPDPYYLSRLESWGFDIPRILVPSGADPRTPIAELALRDTELLGALSELAEAEEDVIFVPYAVTPLEEEIANRCGLRMESASSAVHALINDKIFNRRMAEELGYPVCEGRVCGTAEEVRETFRELLPKYSKVIVKEPYGASGKGLYIVEDESKLSPVLARLTRSAKARPESARWLVEGWHDKQADINYQIYIAPDGLVDVFSIKRQLLRETVYIGSQMPADLGEEMLRRYREYGEDIGRYLHGIGYTGVAGVDSIVTADGTIIPIVEINGRFTLSTYVSFLERVLGEDTRVFSRYFRFASGERLDYEELCAVLDREGLLYRPENREGVLVYTSGTLPLAKEESDGMYAGRIFALIAGRDWELVERLGMRLEQVLRELPRRAQAGREPSSRTIAP
ncbi:peptide ligase PGM1-related protein [Cohnella suwonensis]|uniref:Peptide ligase PGM1-related protein n=1 Tax=Cohnella suwonensis TaxID=696072 RepID=A0ABW0LU30_9BACL